MNPIWLIDARIFVPKLPSNFLTRGAAGGLSETKAHLVILKVSKSEMSSFDVKIGWKITKCGSQPRCKPPSGGEVMGKLKNSDMWSLFKAFQRKTVRNGSPCSEREQCACRRQKESKSSCFSWRLSVSQGYASGYPSSPHFPSSLRLTAGICFKSLCPFPRKTLIGWFVGCTNPFLLAAKPEIQFSVLLTLWVLDIDGFSEQTSM